MISLRMLDGHHVDRALFVHFQFHIVEYVAELRELGVGQARFKLNRVGGEAHGYLRAGIMIIP
jgi:hypothetical protein